MSAQRRWYCSTTIAVLAITHACLAQEPVVESTTDLVGRSREEHIVTPVNQLLTPVGRQVELAGLRPQALALSPDGKLLVVSGKTNEIVVLDPDKAEVKQRVALPSDELTEPNPKEPSPNILQPDRRGQVSYTGLVFSPDGKRIYLSNVNGSIKVFAVGESSTSAATSRTRSWRSTPPAARCCGRLTWGPRRTMSCS
jgi:hypothetical protein